MNKYKNLFLQQSYNDQYETYRMALEQRVDTWDYIVLTASNEKQALAYRQQIEYRLQRGQLSTDTTYLVLPDPNGERVGSGGATLNVMREVALNYGQKDFTGLRILCIHSGGDSKRVPQYSANGKLFSPVPRRLPDGRRSTLFDEFIIGMSGVPSRMNDGMLLCSGDVLLLFNPLQIDFYNKGAAAFSTKEVVTTAKNHGVYVADEEGNVGSFLHKQTEEHLQSKGAVDQHNCCNIDTGAMIFDSNILNDMYTLIDTNEKFQSLVNEQVRLSLYADFSYPLASESTLEQYYKEIPEGDFSQELTEARTLLWDILHKYTMKLIRFSPSAFIHFGTTRELLSLMTQEMDTYYYLGWSANVNSNVKDTHYAVSNSYISKRATIGQGSYIEDSYIHRGVVIGENCVISGVTLQNVTVPSGTVLHGLKLDENQFVVRHYGVNDNPKEAQHFGQEIEAPLWEMSLFPVCETIEEAVNLTLNLKSDVDKKADKESYKNAKRKLSLQESFHEADVTAILPWQEKLDDKIKVESLLEAIEKGQPVEEAMGIFHSEISSRSIRILVEEAERLDETILAEFSTKIRIYYYLSVILTQINKNKDQGAQYLHKSFQLICKALLKTNMPEHLYRSNRTIQKDKVLTKLPVRVNFGGGWSDTPPHCNEHGGTVLNVAIALNGQLPIEVTVEKIDKPVIALASTDIGSYKEFTSLAELQNCTNPYDPFALHKAALIACGIIPLEAEATDGLDAAQITENLGSGFYLNTRVINIPKGSGLGTSSILSGAAVQAIYEFLGIEADEEDIYARVLIMEQLMSTGGGWQDQVGGLTPGLKMLMTDKGLKQEVDCIPVVLSNGVKQELQDRFALIYTGQRRLARNLLQDVIGRYIGNDPVSLATFEAIQRQAVLMKHELQKGNVTAFAKLLSEHWELSKQLDAGCTNTCIDQIFLSIDDLIDGKMICGAGGGGFLQVMLKDGVSKDDLRARIANVFADSGVEVWDGEFVGM